MNENQALAVREEEISAIMERVLSPVLETLARFMQNSSEALNQLSAQQKMQTDRMEALENEARLNAPVTQAMVRYLNAAIKKRAQELISKLRPDADERARQRLARVIRKSVLTLYGVNTLNEVPKHQYNVALTHIGTWMDIFEIQEILKGQ